MLLNLQVVYTLHVFVYMRGRPINPKVMLTIDNIWRSTQRSLDDSICPICDAMKCRSVSFLFLESRCRISFFKPWSIASTASTLILSIFPAFRTWHGGLEICAFSLIYDCSRLKPFSDFWPLTSCGKDTTSRHPWRCTPWWKAYRTSLVLSSAVCAFQNWSLWMAGLQDYIRFHCYGQDITFNAWYLKTGVV